MSDQLFAHQISNTCYIIKDADGNEKMAMLSFGSTTWSLHRVAGAVSLFDQDKDRLELLSRHGIKLVPADGESPMLAEFKATLDDKLNNTSDEQLKAEFAALGVRVRVGAKDGVTRCSCCDYAAATTSPAPYCEDCWNDVVLPSHKHVESLTPDDPTRMMWHGWAIREAFVAGAAAQIRAQIAAQD